MQVSNLLNKVTGGLLVVLAALVVVTEWDSAAGVDMVVPWVALPVIGLLTMQVGPGRYVFVIVAVGLTAALAMLNPDWISITNEGLQTAAFIAAFFSALATLRSAAATSPSITRSGRFLAQQPPGMRYIALTIGGQMFALLLNYGAIALLGSLATASANEEPDAEIRRHRTRRMLLAIQRAFTSTLPWSPLSFAVAISLALIPGVQWVDVVIPGVVTSVLMAGTGWALDSIFKPRLSRARPAPLPPEGNWMLMLPLVALLAILVSSLVILHFATDVRTVGLVLLIVPVIAVVWAIIQAWGATCGPGFWHRVGDYALVELPGFRGEILLLMMAGYIGTVGAPLMLPLLLGMGLDLSLVPTPVVLVALVWIIPLAGQIGMNPILVVTLIAPLVPTAESLGVEPTAVVVAITAGWALSGVTSPFTATTLFIGSFGKVSASHVGLKWNGSYALITACILSIWVLVFANF